MLVTNRDCSFMTIGIVFGLLCGFAAGYTHGQRNPDLTVAEFNAETYPLLVERCQSVMQAEKFADVVLDAISRDKF